jgi:hypothetical protein
MTSGCAMAPELIAPVIASQGDGPGPAQFDARISAREPQQSARTGRDCQPTGADRVGD